VHLVVGTSDWHLPGGLAIYGLKFGRYLGDEMMLMKL
jgi:hypothetical protein